MSSSVTLSAPPSWTAAVPARPRLVGLVGVVALHAALLALVLAVWNAPQAASRVQAALQVALLLPPETPAPAPAAPLTAAPAPAPPLPWRLPVPEVQVAAPAVPAAPAVSAVIAPPPTTPPAPPTQAAALVPSTPAAPPTPARRTLAASAVQYRVLPPVELPRLSRRAGESGTVWLRVVVDRQGLPAQVQVHRSSGHARLDEQAVWAMRQARFAPYVEDGQALEVEVLAPIEYLLD